MGWYALFVKMGKEDDMCEYLDCLLRIHQKIDYKLIVPKRKVVEYKSGKKKLVNRTLFPGYIIVCTEDIYIIFNIIKTNRHTNIYALLRTEDYFQEISPIDIEPIVGLVNQEGIIDISSIFLEKDKVLITEGPLINYMGIVKKANPRKGRIKILLNFLNRNIEMDVGIKCLSKIDEKDIKNTIIF